MSHVGRNIESLCINIKYISLYIYIFLYIIYLYYMYQSHSWQCPHIKCESVRPKTVSIDHQWPLSPSCRYQFCQQLRFCLGHFCLVVPTMCGILCCFAKRSMSCHDFASMFTLYVSQLARTAKACFLPFQVCPGWPRYCCYCHLQLVLIYTHMSGRSCNLVCD